MGFQIPKDAREAKLIFQGKEYEGCEVVCKLSVPLGFSLDIEAAINAGKPTELYRRFADVLVEWNLEDNGQPLPCNEEGLRALDMVFVNMIISAWAEAVKGVSAPLSGVSGNGNMSPEESITAVEQSLNLGSYSTSN